jgi:hypothetical protein
LLSSSFSPPEGNSFTGPIRGQSREKDRGKPVRYSRNGKDPFRLAVREKKSWNSSLELFLFFSFLWESWSLSINRLFPFC